MTFHKTNVDILFKVAPAELEGVLMSHPQVRDAGVFGLPDTQAGELPSAWVVLQPGSKVTEFELQQFVSGNTIYLLHVYSKSALEIFSGCSRFNQIEDDR